jgi:hypothetical protein
LIASLIARLASRPTSKIGGLVLMDTKKSADPNLCSSLFSPKSQKPAVPLIVPMKLPSADVHFPAEAPIAAFLSFTETADLEFSFEGITSQMQLLS